ncbi:uncharacterized protein ACJ7VT_000687 [Polymixia lowei]
MLLCQFYRHKHPIRCCNSTILSNEIQTDKVVLLLLDYKKLKNSKGNHHPVQIILQYRYSLQPATMKYTLIAAFVVLALAQGSLSAETDIEKMTQFFEDMKTKLVATAQEMSETIRVQDLASQAQTHLEPLATQIQEQLKPFAATVEEQLKPLATNVQAQIQPMVQNFQNQMEEMFRQLMTQAKAVGN